MLNLRCPAIRCLLVLSISLLVIARSSAQQSPDAEQVLISDLVTEVQIGLAKAQKELANQKIPTLKSVTLDLVAEAKVAAGGKINLYIFSFGKKWERDRSQEIEVTLKPPSGKQPVQVAKGPSISDQLVSAIVDAGKGIQAARQNQIVPLEASGLKVVLSFVVRGDTSGGVKFEILPVTVDLSGDLAKSAIQKITVVYENPEPKTPK